MAAHELAEQLRNAAAWLRLAADRLEDGKVEDARNMTQSAWRCANRCRVESPR